MTSAEVPGIGDVGERLRSARRRRGLSQRELAAAAGVSLSLVRQIEQEGYDRMRTETRRKLAAVLGVDEKQLAEAPCGTPLWSARDERDRQLGARVRGLLAGHGVRSAEFEAVLTIAARLHAARAEVRELAEAVTR